MIHEIRPGDVVIVTVHESLFDIAKDVTDLQDSILDMTAAGVVTLVPFPNATETSVHILRKADEAKVEAKPGWPAWRKVDADTPPRKSTQLFWCGEPWPVFIGRLEDFWPSFFFFGESLSPTHWMPLPDGPVPK